MARPTPTPAAFLTALALIAPPALAQTPGACPQGPADMAAGIEVVYPSYATRVQAYQNGMFLDFDGSAGNGTTIVTDRGVLIMDTYDVVNGSAQGQFRETLTVNQPLGPIVAGANYGLTGVLMTNDGATTPQTMQVTVGTPRPLTIAGCSYAEALQVTVVGDTAGSAFVEVIEYIPQLGWGIFAGFGSTVMDVEFELPTRLVVAPVNDLVPPPSAQAGGTPVPATPPGPAPGPAPDVIVPSPDK